MTTESLQFELDFSPKPNNYPKIEQEKDPKPMKGDNKAEPKDIRQEKDEKIEKISQVLIGEVEVNYSHKYGGLTSYKIILKNGVIVGIKYKDIWGLRKKVGFREYVDKTTWSLRKGINPSTYIQSRAEFDNLKAFVEEVCKSYHKSLANS